MKRVVIRRKEKRGIVNLKVSEVLELWMRYIRLAAEDKTPLMVLRKP